MLRRRPSRSASTDLTKANVDFAQGSRPAGIEGTSIKHPECDGETNINSASSSIDNGVAPRRRTIGCKNECRAKTVRRLTNQPRLACTAQMPAPDRTIAQRMLNVRPCRSYRCCTDERKNGVVTLSIVAIHQNSPYPRAITAAKAGSSANSITSSQR